MKRAAGSRAKQALGRQGQPLADHDCQLANVTRGLIGPCIGPIAIQPVWETVRAGNTSIIGMGGIQTAANAIEFLMAGATGVGTANFYEP